MILSCNIYCHISECSFLQVVLIDLVLGTGINPQDMFLCLFRDLEPAKSEVKSVSVNILNMRLYYDLLDLKNFVLSSDSRPIHSRVYMHSLTYETQIKWSYLQLSTYTPPSGHSQQ